MTDPTALDDFDKNHFWPSKLHAAIPDSRIWTFGWTAGYFDSTPLTTAANNLLPLILNEWTRDGANASTHPSRLVFVAAGFGGLVAKQLLIHCHSSTSANERAVLESCAGVIFLGTRHSTVQYLGDPILAMYLAYVKSLYDALTLDFPIPSLLKLKSNAESINGQFLRFLNHMPPTFCVANLHRFPSILAVDESNATIPTPRQAIDSVMRISSNKLEWIRKIGQGDGQGHHILSRIIDTVKPWLTAAPTRAASQPQPALQPITGANLLSIDGGGVRGLSSLLILQAVMRKVELIERERDPNARIGLRLPADYFDLAGGTSTGGLGALMLFRLRMDIQSAIEQYQQLCPKIFHQGWRHYLGWNIFKSILGMPWYSAPALEKGIKNLLKRRLPDDEKDKLGNDVPEAKLLAPSPPAARAEGSRQGKMFVCSFRKGDAGAIRLRSYEYLDSPLAQCKIWEAARATSAAPFYFPTAKIQEQKLWDGGLAHNNPGDQVKLEAERIFPSADINCFLSLGTGLSNKPTRSWLPVLGKGKRILKDITNTERVHWDLQEQMNGLYPDNRYFRLNATTGEKEIGLGDYKLMDELEKYTREYLAHDEVRAMIDQCAQRLAKRPPGAAAGGVGVAGANTTNLATTPVVSPASGSGSTHEAPTQPSVGAMDEDDVAVANGS
ncbi:hypothetical protein GP486_003274 [Trichoglossum hirsutum]|uniref:PNPLA domain-containing protein n=1 Tax=Trichoglossum hirsutum TaxID=265104 RepID=A0A9P8RQX0_9PEZI|nr:hypothetical protein GP486_003274 [Trichoglossum hirsutum]